MVALFWVVLDDRAGQGRDGRRRRRASCAGHGGVFWRCSKPIHGEGNFFCCLYALADHTDGVAQSVTFCVLQCYVLTAMQLTSTELSCLSGLPRVQYYLVYVKNGRIFWQQSGVMYTFSLLPLCASRVLVLTRHTCCGGARARRCQKCCLITVKRSIFEIY